jgi:hypothetical protein
MMMATKPKKTTKNRTEGNLFRPVELPFAESKHYKVLLESVRNPTCPSGFDWQYGIVNKLTGILEFRSNSLALAVLVMQNQQQQLDKVITGELNGYSMPAAELKKPEPPDLSLM